MAKVRIDITLDDDIVENLAAYAKAQRTTVSGLINDMLADAMGMKREFNPKHGRSNRKEGADE